MKDHTLTALRSLDPAPSGTLGDVGRRRATARLQQIVASDPTTADRYEPSSRRPTWRVAVPIGAVAAVAAVVATSTIAPSGAAYASWTSTPSSVSSAERSLVVESCRRAAQRADSTPLLVERRGEWVGVALATTPTAYVMCVVELPRGGHRTGATVAAVAGGQGAVPTGSEFTEPAISTGGGPGLLGVGAAPTTSFTIGEVGDDVVGVRITTPSGRKVDATVQGGRYFAWWPGTAFGTKTEGNGGPAPALSYSITRTDGTIVRNARPVDPS